MGSAASIPDEAKKMKEKELEELVAKLDKDTLKTVQEVVNRAASAKPKAKKDVHNVDEASNMKRAIFTWDYDTCVEALKEIELADKAPMGIEGAYLITDPVFKGDDATNWEKMMGLCAAMFFQDQADAKVPYMPDEEPRKHAVWMMSAEEVEKTFKGLGVIGKDGKELMMKYEEQPEKVSEMVQSEGVKFMKACAKYVQSLEE